MLDWDVMQDKEVLDNAGSNLEFKII